MDVDMTIEGLKYMLLGMTTVFLFLLLIIFILKIQTKILHKLFPPKSLPITAAKTNQKDSSLCEDEELIAVITAALTEYKKG